MRGGTVDKGIALIIVSNSDSVGRPLVSNDVEVLADGRVQGRVGKVGLELGRYLELQDELKISCVWEL